MWQSGPKQAKRSGKGRNTRKTRKNRGSKITDRSAGNGQMSLLGLNTNDWNETERLHINLKILTWSSDNGHVWQNLTGYRQSLFITWNLAQLYVQKVRFCQLAVFAPANNNLWGQVRIEIPYATLFPLQVPHPNPIKTRNPAPTRNCNSRFRLPALFSAQISHQKGKRV